MASAAFCSYALPVIFTVSLSMSQSPLFSATELEVLPEAKKTTGLKRQPLHKPFETVLLRPKEGKITFVSRKLFNALLWNAQRNPSVFGQYQSIPMAALARGADYTSRNVEHITEVLNNMLATVVNWGGSTTTEGGGKYRWEGSALLAYARIERTERGPNILYYDFHPELLRKLANPEQYVVLNLLQAANLSTLPALTLYEIALAYRTNKNGSRSLPWREWVAPLTGNPDVNPDLQYKYFARDVLRPALAEVNAVQDDFIIEMQTDGANRRVESLKFVVRPNPAAATKNQPLAMAGLPVEAVPVLGALLNKGISQPKGESYIRQYGLPRVQAALRALESHQNVKSAPAYFATLLKNGDLSKFEDVADVEGRDIPDAEALIEEPDPVQKFLMTYQESVKAEAFAVFREASTELQLEIFRQFEATALPNLSGPVQKSWVKFRALPPGSPIPPFVAVNFRDWLARGRLTPTAEELLQWGLQQKSLGHTVLPRGKT